MGTSLPLYLAAAPSQLLPGAGTLYTIGGTPTTTQVFTLVGNATMGYGEIAAQGTMNAWASSGSIGDPSGVGFLYEGTDLDFSTFIPGPWSASLTLCAAQRPGSPQVSSLLVGDLILRVYKYAVGGTYTLLVTLTALGQRFGFSPSLYRFPVVQAAGMDFLFGEKLYADLWCRVTSNSNGRTTQGFLLGNLSLDTVGQTGSVGAFINTPDPVPLAGPPPSILPVQQLLGTLPVIVDPNFEYQAGSTPLDIPIAATAPMVQNGQVFVGSRGTLFFQNPSTSTQSALTTGTTVLLTFALATGEAMTCPVSLTTQTISGSLVYAGRAFSSSVLYAPPGGVFFAVTFTVVARTIVSNWVTTTQFA